MKIVVTGGAGFIASHIVDAYVERGHEVHIIDDFSTGQKANLNAKATLHTIDIADAQAGQLIEQFFDGDVTEAWRGDAIAVEDR